MAGAADSATAPSGFDWQGCPTTFPVPSPTEFTYDDANNPATSGWSVNTTNDQLSWIPTNTYTYDGMGRLATSAAGATTFGFNYNVLGQLTASSTGATATWPASAATTFSYEYDGRARLTAIRDAVTPANTQYFAYANDLEPVAWRKGNRCLYFVYGSQPHVPDLAYEDSNCADTTYSVDKVYRYLTDERGSVTGVVRIQGGTVATLDPMTFNEWGGFVGSARPVTQPFGYAGGIFMPTGMWHFGARDYHPGLRRWTARDPSGFEGGLNLYEYAGSDPINRIDPTGLYSVEDFHRDFWTNGVVAFWESPSTTIGGIVGLLGSGTNWHQTEVNGAIHYEARDNAIIRAISGPNHGVTLGRVTCYSSPEVRPRLRRHENAHIPQSQVMGPLYLPAHIVAQGASVLISQWDPMGYAQTMDAYSAYNPLEWGPYSEPSVPWSGPPS